MTIRNAKITSTMLGVEDHGIMTFFLTVEWQGGGVGIGGYALDGPDPANKDAGFGAKARVGYGHGYQAIRRVLEIVGVDTWEKLRGQYCRIDDDGPGARVSKIGNLMKDEWFDLATYMKEGVNKND